MNDIERDRYAVIGDPIKHSRSPVIHTVFAEQTGQAITYESIRVAPDELENMITRFQRGGGRGLNVTVPHKGEVVRLVDELSDHAASAGAVNTLTISRDSIVGDNTDGVGLVRDLLRNKRWGLADKRILILGAGGATRGIVRPLLEEQVAEITIANRTVDKAIGLAAHFSAHGSVLSARFDDLHSHGPYDLIINATSAWLRGESPDFPGNLVNEYTACYDLAYGASATPFLDWARGLGSERLATGWGMLVEQAAESFRLWRGVIPDTESVIAQFPG